MTDPTSGEADPLQAVLALTPAGREELREPHTGLSLPQRWLLAHLDGRSRLHDLVGRPGSPTAERLPRDAAKLIRLGLAVGLAGAGPLVPGFGPSTLHDDLTIALPLDDAGGAAPPAPSVRPARPRAARVVLAGALVVMAAAAYLAAGGTGKVTASARTATSTPDTPVPSAAAGASAAAAALPSSARPAAAVAASNETAAAVVELTADPAGWPRTRPWPLTPSRSRRAIDASPAASEAGADAPANSAAPASAPQAVPAALATTPSVAAPAVAASAVPAAVLPPSLPAAPPGSPSAASAPASSLSPPPALPPVVSTGLSLRPVGTVEPDVPHDVLGVGIRAALQQPRFPAGGVNPG